MVAIEKLFFSDVNVLHTLTLWEILKYLIILFTEGKSIHIKLLV